MAVDDLTVNMYKDQIFALLGHNGAGKTTTISILTGMLTKTCGRVEMKGETDVDTMRAMIGICPQHDTLYEELTVEEHLELFATFRDLEGEELEAEVNKLIVDVNLHEKRDEYSKNLSGGQKRRLSVAMAFAGRSKVIILDEPTSGMDTSARRLIWDLLKKYRNDRIIILTTHFMDEADYLGDRIGIMGGGRLLCCGSGIYLKNNFGVGYTITLVKENSEVNSGKITALMREHVPNLNVLSDVSSELVVQLPLDQIPNFPNLFGNLDAKLKELGLLTYGISITTLEEVFLRVETSHKEEKKAAMGETTSVNLLADMNKKVEEEEIGKPARTRRDSYSVINFGEFEQPSTCEVFGRHFLGTILKRMRVIKRDYRSFILELILPVVIIFLSLMLMRINFIVDDSAETVGIPLYVS